MIVFTFRSGIENVHTECFHFKEWNRNYAHSMFSPSFSSCVLKIDIAKLRRHDCGVLPFCAPAVCVSDTINMAGWS